MENKYYTPKIEDLHIGQGVMLLDTNNYNSNSQCVSYPVVAKVSGLDSYPTITVNTGDEGNGHYEVYESQLGVKYLDVADIESLGFITFKNPREGWNFYDSGDFTIRVKDEDDNYYRIFKADPDHAWGKALFRGIIKNKSELKKVLKQIGYEE